MKNEYYTVEDGVNQLREDKGKPGTLGGLFYALVGNSTPEILEKLEEHFATVMVAGQNVAVEIEKADKDPEKKKAFMRELINITNKKKSFLDEEDDG